MPLSLLALVALFAALENMLRVTPPGLASFWLACGPAIGVASRWPWRRALPLIAVAMLAGAWSVERPSGREAIECMIAVGQCSMVAWCLRRSLPRLLADRRPIYRVRLAHLSIFLFGVTLPSSMLAGGAHVLVEAGLGTPAEAAAREGLLYAAASGLSIAVMAPLMWPEQLRAVSWRGATATAMAAAALTILVASEPRLLWLAPLVMLLAGYFGSTWCAVLCAAVLGAGLLVQMQLGALQSFEGPDALVIWLLVVWRLFTAGLLASLWSDRRSRSIGRTGRGCRVEVSAERAQRWWRTASRTEATWVVAFLGVPPVTLGDAHQRQLAPGSSLQTLGRLSRLSRVFREGDALVGVGANDAMLILCTQGDKVPGRAALASRCKAAVEGELELGRVGPADVVVVSFLLTSAAHLDSEPAADSLAAPAGPVPPGWMTSEARAA